LVPGGLHIEPHPRIQAILDDDKEIDLPQLRRVPVRHSETIAAWAP